MKQFMENILKLSYFDIKSVCNSCMKEVSSKSLKENVYYEKLFTDFKISYTKMNLLFTFTFSTV